MTQNAIVERGKNIVSVSKDSYICLWNCGQSKLIEPKIEINDCINCLDINESNLNLLENEENSEDLEIGTQGKVLLVGTENGSVHLVDLKGRTILKSAQFSSAVNCINFFLDNFAVIGTQEGKISILSLPNLEILSEIHDSESSIVSLMPLRSGFVVGKFDGTCLWHGFEPRTGEISNEIINLSGADVDPINGIAKDSEYIYTACRDGIIRKYSINEMF